jgi:neutral amino acid transport system permease protein
MTELLQTTIDGLSIGSIYALAAIGLTLVYGILRLVNFAHGDFMTLGGYVAFAVNVSAGVNIGLAILAALAAVAMLGLASEYAIWRPMRRRGAGMLQLLLLSLGFAFVIRYMIQFQWTGQLRQLDVDATKAFNPGDLTISYVQLIVIAGAGTILSLVAILLKTTMLGKSMRALADNFDLAEVSGIDTSRVIAVTWLLAAGLAGLAGVATAIYQSLLTPDTGFVLLLSVFAAVIVGGIGNAYGALAGGLLIGLVQEWSTIGGLVPVEYKETVGFAILILALLIRPQGIFGHAVRAT